MKNPPHTRVQNSINTINNCVKLPTRSCPKNGHLRGIFLFNFALMQIFRDILKLRMLEAVEPRRGDR